MFKHKKSVDPNQQIPYPLYESLRQNSSRRGRWIIEVLIAAVVIIVLGLGSIKLYASLHKTKEPSANQSSSSKGGTSVAQPPQTNKNTEPTVPPARTSAGNSNNGSAVSQPSGD